VDSRGERQTPRPSASCSSSFTRPSNPPRPRGPQGQPRPAHAATGWQRQRHTQHACPPPPPPPPTCS
jgi:hypothetical protein